MIQTPFLSSPPTPPVASWRSLTYGIVALAPSLFISRLGWVGMKVTDTALLGHVGTHALAASSLSDLWTMASGVFIQGRVLGIFVGNAVGAAKAGTAPWSVAGEWFQVSVAVLGVIALAVMGLWAITEPVLRLFGYSSRLLSDASFFSLVLVRARARVRVRVRVRVRLRLRVRARGGAPHGQPERGALPDGVHPGARPLLAALAVPRGAG